MIILGIDPGTNRVGYGVLKNNSGSLKSLDYGCVNLKSSKAHNGNLLDIHNAVCSLINKWQPDILAIEKLFFFKNAKTVIRVSEARGVILLAAFKNKIDVVEFTPLQVKQAVSAYGRAQKAAVQKMVRLILGLAKDPQPDDAADALAIAICCANTTII